MKSPATGSQMTFDMAHFPCCLYCHSVVLEIARTIFVVACSTIIPININKYSKLYFKQSIFFGIFNIDVSSLTRYQVLEIALCCESYGL